MEGWDWVNVWRRGEARKELVGVSKRGKGARGRGGKGMRGGGEGKEGEGEGDGMGRGEREGDVLHAAGTAPSVAVVEFESFALEDECAEAILVKGGVLVMGTFREG